MDNPINRRNFLRKAAGVAVIGLIPPVLSEGAIICEESLLPSREEKRYSLKDMGLIEKFYSQATSRGNVIISKGLDGGGRYFYFKTNPISELQGIYLEGETEERLNFERTMPTVISVSRKDGKRLCTMPFKKGEYDLIKMRVQKIGPILREAICGVYDLGFTLHCLLYGDKLEEMVLVTDRYNPIPDGLGGRIYKHPLQTLYKSWVRS